MNDQQQIDALSLATDVTIACLANPYTRVVTDAVLAFLIAVYVQGRA